MTLEKKRIYLITTKDKGNKRFVFTSICVVEINVGANALVTCRLDFRFAH